MNTSISFLFSALFQPHLPFHLITGDFNSLQCNSNHFKFKLWQFRIPSFPYLCISLESCKFWGPFRGLWCWGSVIGPSAGFCSCLLLLMWLLTPTDVGLTKMAEVPNSTVVHAAICWCFLLLLLWDLLRCPRWLLKFIS